MRSCLRSVVCCIVVCGFGCTDEPSDAGSGDAGKSDAGGADAGNTGYKSAVYALDENWVCNPAAKTNRCKSPRAATEVASDATLKQVSAPSKVTSKTDCFYVYPTVDLSMDASQVADYSNIEDIWASVTTQAEQFSHLCTVYAPLYHQVKIGGYLSPSRDALLDKAYEEIDDAFQHYMGQYNKGHDIIFIGHSQGSHMLRRLLQKHFDGDANKAVREKLSLAVLAGTLGDIHVPTGKLVGGSFSDIPACSDDAERACVITWSSYTAAAPPDATYGILVGGIPDGQDTPCNNPAALSGGKAKARGAYFQSTATGVAATTTSDLAMELGVKTEFAVYRDMYSLECKQNSVGHSYLAVSTEQAANAKRTDPIQYMAPGLQLALVGLHILDINFMIDDLAAIIRKHVE